MNNELFKCPTCKKPMVNAYDTKLKKISPYLWRTDCGHHKDILISKG